MTVGLPAASDAERIALAEAVTRRLIEIGDPSISPPPLGGYRFRTADAELGETLRVDIPVGGGVVVPLWADPQTLRRARKTSSRALADQIAAQVEKALGARDRIAERLEQADAAAQAAVAAIGGGLRLHGLNVEPLRIGSTESMLKKGFAGRVETLDDRLLPADAWVRGHSVKRLVAELRELRLDHQVRADAKTRLDAAGAALAIDIVTLRAIEAAGGSVQSLAERLMDTGSVLEIDRGDAHVSSAHIGLRLVHGVVRARFDLPAGHAYADGRLRLPHGIDAPRRAALRRRPTSELLASPMLDGTHITGFEEFEGGPAARLYVPSARLASKTFEVMRR